MSPTKRQRLLATLGTLAIAVGTATLTAPPATAAPTDATATVTVTVTATPTAPATTTPAPATTPAATSAPSTTTANTTQTATTGLPAKVAAMWWHTWDGPTLAEIPADVAAINNVYIAAIAQSAAAGTGNLAWTPSIKTSQEDIAAMQAKGNLVLIGIGGSSDGGITVQTPEHVTQFVGSVDKLVTEYGFNGIDLDLEPSGSKWNQESLVAVADQLKAKYGKDFVIGLTVGMYGEHTARWLALANAMGESYDYWAPMLYDFPEAHDSRLTEVALDKVETAVAGGVPASKQILGFMCNAYYNTSTPQVTQAALDAVEAKHPDIRGAFVWETKLEAANNYEWSRSVGETITGLNPL